MNPKTPAESLSLAIGDLNILQRRLEWIVDEQGGDGSELYCEVGRFAAMVSDLRDDIVELRAAFVAKDGLPGATKAPLRPMQTHVSAAVLNPTQLMVEMQREMEILRAEVAVLEGKLEGRIR